jgi:cytochrome c peroxidase
VLAAVAAIVVAGFAVAALSRDDRPQAAIVDTNHGNVKLAKGEMQRVLNAVDATTAGTARDELVAEGRKLFRDPSRFEKGESCQTCHAEGSASPATGTMVHDKDAPKGNPDTPHDFDGPRDPPALWGLAKTQPFFWNGNVPTLEAAIVRPVMGHMKDFVAGGIPGDCEPAPDGTRPDGCDARAGELAAQIIAYVKTLDPPSTSFDQGTMSKEALAGEKLFQGKGGCIECHGGPLFTDNLEHNTGVPQVLMPGSSTRMSFDLGAKPPPVPAECTGANPPAGCDQPAADQTLPCDPANQVVRGRCSAFINTPHLRDLKHTAPYMHNGAFATLKEVVDFYNQDSALSPLNLSTSEVDELVAYLESL